MHAKVIQLCEPGPALGLRPASLMLPPPAPNALTVRHTAVGVNFVDVYHRAGLYPVPDRISADVLAGRIWCM